MFLQSARSPSRRKPPGAVAHQTAGVGTGSAAAVLDPLADGSGRDRQSQDGEPLGGVQGHHRKHRLQGRQEEHGALQKGSGQKGTVHSGVRKDPQLEDRAVVAAHIVGVKELAEGEGGEGHGIGGLVGLIGVGEDILPQKIGCQGHQPHQHALPSQLEGEAAGEQGGAGRSGRLLHHILLHRLHPQRQGGQGVGDQVEPQELDGDEGELAEVQDGG